MNFEMINSISTPDLIGWAGTAFFIYGVWAIGNKNINGFYFNFLGNLAYLIQGAIVSLYSLAFLSFLLMILNIRGVMQWSKTDKKPVKGAPRYLNQISLDNDTDYER